MAYSYSRSITIDHTKVGATHTDFPVLISGTYTYLKTVGNGGKVQSSSGYDIIFTSDSAGNNLLSWEQVNWGASTGTVEYHVKVSSLSSSSDTVIYMWYGNSSTSSFQGGSLGAAWNSNYKHVLHVKDGTTLTTTESTSNGNDGTNSSATATTGQIDGGVAVTAGSKITMTKNLMSIIGSSNAHTISMWVYFTSHGATDYIWDLDTANGLGAFCNLAASGVCQWGYAGTYRTYTTATTNTGQWYYVVFEKTGSGDNGDFYINGTKQTGATGTLGNPNTAASTGSQWGAYHSSSALCLDGKMDELRIANVALGQNWYTTEYNNQNSPSTFYTIGAEVIPGIVGGATIVTKQANQTAVF